MIGVIIEEDNMLRGREGQKEGWAWPTEWRRGSQKLRQLLAMQTQLITDWVAASSSSRMYV